MKPKPPLPVSRDPIHFVSALDRVRARLPQPTPPAHPHISNRCQSIVHLHPHPPSQHLPTIPCCPSAPPILTFRYFDHPSGLPCCDISFSSSFLSPSFRLFDNRFALCVHNPQSCISKRQSWGPCRKHIISQRRQAAIKPEA